MVAVAAPEYTSQYFEPYAIGPVAQADISTWAGLAAAGPPGATIANASSYTSGVIPAGGFKAIGVGVKSTNTGVISIQRFLDRAGLVPVGAAVTATLVAGVANWATVNDGLPFQSFSFSISNTGAGIATITNFACLLNAG